MICLAFVSKRRNLARRHANYANLATHVGLNGVPGLGDMRVVSVQLDGRVHLLLHATVDFEPEHVAENARSHHDDEQDDQNGKVGYEHTLDLLVGAEGAQNADN